MEAYSVNHLSPLETQMLWARFWSKVEVRGPEECWPWRTPGDQGYGGFRIGEHRLVASRLAYLFAFGKLDNALVVMHLCDNPPCCNPLHLRQGTVAENNEDCRQKGRRPVQMWPGRAVLTPEQVVQIRRKAAEENTPFPTLALEYNVSPETIGRVVRGATFPTLGGPRVRRGSGRRRTAVQP